MGRAAGTAVAVVDRKVAGCHCTVVEAGWHTGRTTEAAHRAYSRRSACLPAAGHRAARTVDRLTSLLCSPKARRTLIGDQECCDVVVYAGAGLGLLAVKSCRDTLSLIPAQ